MQRSTKGKAFESIGTVKGSGTSSQPVRYSFTDRAPLGGTVYYRLKQVDFDGSFEFSNIIVVSARGIATDMQLQVYLNPFSSELNVAVTALKNGRAELQLIDLQGRVVHSSKVELHPGLNELTLPLSHVQNGLYILKLSGNGISGTVKVPKK